MMDQTISFQRVIEIYRIETVELTTWIAKRWVRPEETSNGYVFDDVDRARIALIRDLREDLMVNDDSLTLILSLLDQLYSTRRALRSVQDALEMLPDDVRNEIHSRLRAGERL
jgi:chaperone modulatory protein CbpM